MSDAELVRQARAGRTEAFEELVRRWAGKVTALCHARVGRAHVADDLAQETLLRGFRALASLNDPDRFGPWLCGIALRTCLDWLKAKQNSQVPFSVLHPDDDPNEFLPGRDDSTVERDDEARYLLAEVERLPEDCRQVVMLYYYQDVTYRDIARLLGVSTATINCAIDEGAVAAAATINRGVAVVYLPRRGWIAPPGVAYSRTPGGDAAINRGVAVVHLPRRGWIAPPGVAYSRTPGGDVTHPRRRCDAPPATMRRTPGGVPRAGYSTPLG